MDKLSSKFRSLVHETAFNGRVNKKTTVTCPSKLVYRQSDAQKSLHFSMKKRLAKISVPLLIKYAKKRVETSSLDSFF